MVQEKVPERNPAVFSDVSGVVDDHGKPSGSNLVGYTV